MKICLLGGSGSGKTTYIMLLYGYFISKGLIKWVELENLPRGYDVVKMLENVKPYQLPIGGLASKIMKTIKETWLSGRGAPKSIGVTECALEMNVPVYSKPGRFNKVRLYFPDPAGDAFEYLPEILEGIDIDDPLNVREIRAKLINILREKKRTDPQLAEPALKVLTQKDYDGILLFVDPNLDPKVILDNTFLSAVILQLLLVEQRKKPAVEIIFPKSIYRKLISKRDIEIATYDFESFKEIVYTKAIDTLKEKYTYLFRIIQRFFCYEKRIRFAGAFCYDAFVSSKLIEKKDRGEEIAPDLKDGSIKSFNFLLPLCHLVHVINNANSPINYQGLITSICEEE